MLFVLHYHCHTRSHYRLPASSTARSLSAVLKILLLLIRPACSREWFQSTDDVVDVESIVGREVLSTLWRRRKLSETCKACGAVGPRSDERRVISAQHSGFLRAETVHIGHRLRSHEDTPQGPEWCNAYRTLTWLLRLPRSPVYSAAAISDD